MTRDEVRTWAERIEGTWQEGLPLCDLRRIPITAAMQFPITKTAT
jgi:hypothetical protein